MRCGTVGIDDLISRLEVAPVGNSGFDYEIHFMITDGIGCGAYGQQPAYTQSLDAAFTLVPGGSYATVNPWFSNDPDDRWVKWEAYIITPHWDKWTPFEDWFTNIEARGLKTPALAVTTAALKARRS